MKHSLLIAAFAFAAGAQAQLVDSDFEAWTGNIPDGWFGMRSSIASGAISQVATNPHGGTYAVRLENTLTVTGDHKRFSTQDVTVETGTEYTVSFWARGKGDVRVGVYDGRSGNGYSPYTPYTTVNNNDTWQQITLTVTTVMDATNAQFILSVKSTVAPEHLVIDDLTVTAGAAIPVVTINQIQLTSDPEGASDYADMVVQTSGIVTATYITLDDQNLPEFRYSYLQNGTGAWNGVVIFDYADNENNVNIGDALTLVATVNEFSKLTELVNIQSFTVTATGQELPAPLVVETSEVASEALESVLVQVVNAQCTVVPSGATFGKWNVNDDSGDAVVGKVIHTVSPEPELGQVFNVTGVVSFTNFGGSPEYNIQPRDANDVQLIMSIADAGVLGTATFGPNPAVDVLNVNLGQAAGQRVEYTLTDVQGRTLRNGILTSDRAQVAVGDLANGTYHFTLRSAELRKSFPVQIVR